MLKLNSIASNVKNSLFYLPLKSMLREDFCGEPGAGKEGIARALNWLLELSCISNYFLGILDLRSVLRLNSFG